MTSPALCGPNLGDKPVFNLQFETSNDVFVQNWNSEAARILRKAADEIDVGCVSNTIRDINGNSIGQFSITVAPQEEVA